MCALVAASLVAFVWLSAADASLYRKAALLAWGLLAGGILIGATSLRRPPGSAHLLLAGLASMTALTAIGLLTTTSVERTFEELIRVMGFAGLALLGLCTMRRRAAQTVFVGISIGVVAVCGIALASRLLPALFSEPEAGERLAYPFGYWNALAAWCAMTVSLLLAWVSEGRTRIDRGAACAALPGVFVTLYLTQSRGGFMMCALGVAILFLLSRHRMRLLILGGFALFSSALAIAWLEAHPEIAGGSGGSGSPAVLLGVLLASLASWIASQRWLRGTRAPSPDLLSSSNKARRALIALSVVIGALVFVPFVLGAIFDDEPVGAVAPSSGSARLLTLEGNRPLYWDRALEASLDRPVSGLGAGTYEFYWSQHGQGPEEVRDAHSFYLESMAELGLAGLIASLLIGTGLVWLGLLPLRSGVKGPASIGLPAAIGVLIGYLGIDWVWESPSVMLLGLACAVTAGAAGSMRIKTRRDSASARGISSASAWVLGILSVLGLGLQIPGLVKADRIEASESASLAGLQEDAIALASEAIEAQPWAATAYERRAAAYVTAGDIESARADLEAAASREPENYRYPLASAALDLRLGDAASARQQLQRARALAPRAIAVAGETGARLEARISSLEATQAGD